MPPNGNCYQQDIASNCLRFTDASTAFNLAELNLLLRAVQANDCGLRVRWFDAVRSCRRRSQIPWARTSLALLFTTADQYELLESRAQRLRIRTLIKRKGLFVVDAFRMFNRAGNGTLTCTEFYSGVCWLGLTLSVESIHSIVRSIDSDNDGLISIHDFKSSFHEDGDEEEVLAASVVTSEMPGSPLGRTVSGKRAGVGATGRVVIPQRGIPELCAELQGEDESGPQVADVFVRSVKLKVTECGDELQQVWSSEGSTARHQLSIWSATGGGAKGERYFLRVGDYPGTQQYSEPFYWSIPSSYTFCPVCPVCIRMFALAYLPVANRVFSGRTQAAQRRQPTHDAAAVALH